MGTGGHLEEVMFEDESHYRKTKLERFYDLDADDVKKFIAPLFKKQYGLEIALQDCGMIAGSTEANMKKTIVIYCLRDKSSVLEDECPCCKSVGKFVLLVSMYLVYSFHNKIRVRIQCLVCRYNWNFKTAVDLLALKKFRATSTWNPGEEPIECMSLNDKMKEEDERLRKRHSDVRLGIPISRLLNCDEDMTSEEIAMTLTQSQREVFLGNKNPFLRSG